GVGEAEAGAEFASVFGDVVEVARLVAVLEVEGRRDPSVFEGEAGDGGLDGAGGAEGVGVVRFGPAGGDAVAAFAEELFEGVALGGVVEGGGGSVGADVIH